VLGLQTNYAFYSRVMMTKDLLLMLSCGMMVMFGGLLLTHTVLRIVQSMGNWLILFL